jgi:hypothetical protein
MAAKMNFTVNGITKFYLNEGMLFRNCYIE